MSSTDGTHDLEEQTPRPQAASDQEPGPGEVRLSVRAIGIDRAEKPFDIGQSRTRETSPARIEYDVVGVVEAVGDGVEQSRLGQRVVAIPPPLLGGRGVYADLAVFPVESLLPWTHIPIVPMMTNALTLRAHSIWHTTSDPATLATAVETILRDVATGKYQPLLDQIFPLSQIAEAHRYLDSYDCMGKTVVLPGPVGARG